MLTLKGKKPFKRKGSYYFTLTVENDTEDTLVANEKNKWKVRPRLVQKGDLVIHDPKLGRSGSLELVPGKNTIKVRISEDELREIDGAGEYTVTFGLVHELKKWYLPMYDAVLEVAELEPAPVLNEKPDDVVKMPYTFFGKDE